MATPKSNPALSPWLKKQPKVTRYWINTLTRDHLEKGLAGGFTQAEHGRAGRIRNLALGDFVVFYSPRTHFQRRAEPLRSFTAIGRVLDEVPYQVKMSPEFHPWRRRMEFVPCRETPVKPLAASLDFIPDKQNWGFPFKRGLFQISEEDFRRIAQAMGAKIPRSRKRAAATR